MCIRDRTEAAGRSIRELERLRDDYLVAIQQVLRQYNIGAGSTLRALEERLYADAARQVTGGTKDSGAQFLRYSSVVRAEWADYNNHMSDFRYAQVFGDAMDALYRSVGVDDAYRTSGQMFYTVESHTTHCAEAYAGDSLYVTTRILAVDDKRLHVIHQMYRGRDDVLVATGEQLHLHVSTAAAKAVPMEGSVRASLDALRSQQAQLPVPPLAGRAIHAKNR